MQLDEQTLSDIHSAPKGPATAALFDFDGTLIAGFSVVQFLREQVSQRKLSLDDARRMVINSVRLMAQRASFSELFTASCELLAGAEEAEYAAFGRDVYEKRIARLIYPEARALIREHKARGHTVAIVSSATAYQVHPAAADLGVDTVCCTQLGVADGVFTGEVEGVVCWGDGKLAAAQKLAKDAGFPLDRAFFYSDSDEDIPLLDTVAYPRVLNPNRKLARVAKERGWPVRRFRDLRKVTTTSVIRTLAADLSMLPVMLTSLSVMSMTGSRRDAQNFTSAVYPAIASALSGVTLDVTGEKNLWAARPAVFVFNHQSKIDPVIVSKLLHKDFVGVGKKEIASLPFAGKLMEFGGAVLIDRADSVGAVAALQPLVNVIREEKKSVVMAPEGKRTVSPRLASFKKGPFHLAIQAGVPMVPIVLHDAIDIAPKGTFLYRPGQVRVEILPPVDTSAWSPATIDEHVAEVRSLFLSALGQEEPAGKPVSRRNRRSKTSTRKAAPRRKAAAGKSRAGAAKPKSAAKKSAKSRRSTTRKSDAVRAKAGVER
jgi:putative phosphoserine phosphatase/1-acylglycerol-3-phosphate O-acyltransferase